MEYLLVIYSSISSLSVLLLCFLSRHYDFSPIYCDKIIKMRRSVPHLWYQKIKQPTEHAQSCFYLLFMVNYVILCMLSLHSGIRKEVISMEYIITIFLAVMAQVIGHYVCKWLGRQHHDN